MFLVTMSHTFSEVLFLRLQFWYGSTDFISTTWHTLLAILEVQECIQIQVDTKKMTYQDLRERKRIKGLD